MPRIKLPLSSYFAALLVSLFVFIAANFVFAAAGDLPGIIKDQQDALAEIGLPGGNTSPLDVIIDVVRLALGMLAVLFLVIIIIAGFRWMTSDGNSETIEKAKKSIQAGIIGLAVIAFSYAITLLVFKILGEVK